MPTPEVFKMEDEEEENEGGEKDSNDKENSSSSNRPQKPYQVQSKRSKGGYNEINQSEHSKRNDDGIMDVDIEDAKSEIKLRNNNEEIKERLAKLHLIDDIPLSAFGSSDSSSSDTFESYNKDELIDELKNNRTQVIVERLSNEEESKIESEQNHIMINLSDIPVEIDQGLSDKRIEGLTKMNVDNGKAFRNKIYKEQEVKLFDGNSLCDDKSISEFVPRVNGNLRPHDRIEDNKTVSGERLEEFKNEVYFISNMQDLENEM